MGIGLEIFFFFFFTTL